MSGAALAPPDPIRVLLVDDQALFREGIAVILQAAQGVEVVAQAGNGEEGVTLADEHEPDVVIMDIRMPVVDGVEATRRLFAPERAAQRRRPLRVIILTTFNLDDRAALAIRLGASGFLLKDATPAMLVDAVRTVHTGNAVLAPSDLANLLDASYRPVRAVPPAYESLTDKEHEVFLAVAAGLSNQEISARMFASESTVKTHVGSVLRKLGLRDRVQIVVFAHEHALV